MSAPYLPQWAAGVLVVLAAGLAVACSGGGSFSDPANVTIYLKAQSGDQVKAYLLDGSSTNPGTLMATSTYDLSTSSAALALSDNRSYRLRLVRSGVAFMETALLSEQFSKASGGVLNAGEVSGLTTSFVQAAIHDASANNRSLENELRADLLDRKLTGMEGLLLSKASSLGFSQREVNHFNLVIITLARFSKAFESTSTARTQDDWDSIVALFHAWFSDSAAEKAAYLNANLVTLQTLTGVTLSKESGREAVTTSSISALDTSLAAVYLALVNSGKRALPSVSATEIQNLYIQNADHSLANFLSAAQSTSSADGLKLATLVGASETGSTIAASSFELAHSTYGYRSGDNFVVNSLAPVFVVQLALPLPSSFSNLVTLKIVHSDATGGLAVSESSVTQYVRQVDASSTAIYLMVLKAASATITRPGELAPGHIYGYTITPKSGYILNFRGSAVSSISGSITTRNVTFTYPVTSSTTDSMVDLGFSTFRGLASTTPSFLVHSRYAIDQFNSSAASSGYGVLSYITVTMNNASAFNTAQFVTVSDASSTGFMLAVKSGAGLASGGTYDFAIAPSKSSAKLSVNGGTLLTNSDSSATLGSGLGDMAASQRVQIK